MSTFLLTHLLASAVARHPGRPAVLDGDRSCTYTELDDRARRIATALCRWGVGPGDRVGLHLDKSIVAVAAIYGILQAGAAYVPVDPAGPLLRSAAILGNADVACVVLDDARLGSWTGPDAPELPSRRVLVVDADPQPGVGGLDVVGASELASLEPMATVRSAISHDLAYILYTSGSTGVPKGVMLTHRNALAFVVWAAEHYGLTENDVVSSVAPFHFDLSTFDLYSACAAGAALALVSREQSAFPVALRRALETMGVTTCYAVPSLLTMLSLRGGLDAQSLPSLRQILFAGEVFPTRHLRTLMKQLPHVSLHNLYGPTETNVCTYYDLWHTPPVGDDPIPIGRAIDDVELVVVDEAGQVVAPGEVGELLVRGATVMQGYYGDGERTRRSLVPHPARPEVADLCYRTGDLVRANADGDLDFLGRRDNQTKSRGYRIELGEVEAALYAHPQVVEAVVAAVPDQLVGNRLMAVVVTSGLDVVGLTAHCRDRLPHYMLPDDVLLVPELPKTSTGKVDRQAIAGMCRTYKEESA